MATSNRSHFPLKDSGYETLPSGTATNVENHGHSNAGSSSAAAAREDDNRYSGVARLRQVFEEPAREETAFQQEDSHEASSVQSLDRKERKRTKLLRKIKSGLFGGSLRGRPEAKRSLASVVENSGSNKELKKSDIDKSSNSPVPEDQQPLIPACELECSDDGNVIDDGGLDNEDTEDPAPSSRCSSSTSCDSAYGTWGATSPLAHELNGPYQLISDFSDTESRALLSSSTTGTPSFRSYTGTSDSSSHHNEPFTQRALPRSNDPSLTAYSAEVSDSICEDPHSDEHALTAHSAAVSEFLRDDSRSRVGLNGEPPIVPHPDLLSFVFPSALPEDQEHAASPRRYQLEERRFSFSSSTSEDHVDPFKTPPRTPVMRTPPPPGTDYVPVEVEPYMVPKITVSPGESMLDMCMEMNRLAEEAPETFSTRPPVAEEQGGEKRAEEEEGGTERGRDPAKMTVGRTLGRALSKLFKRQNKLDQ